LRCLSLHDDGSSGKKIIGEMEVDMASLIMGNAFGFVFATFL